MRLRCLIGLLLLPLISSPLLAADRGCVRPEVNALLERSRELVHEEMSFAGAEAVFVSSTDKGVSIQWMGTRWSDYEGTVFVLDCRGKVLTTSVLGSVVRMRRGPVLPGLGLTVEVVYIPGHASSVRWESVALLVFQNNSIRVLWERLATERVAAGTMAEYDDIYRWKFARGGSVIWVAGKRHVHSVPDDGHGWAPNSIHTFPGESWCWMPAVLEYRACTETFPGFAAPDLGALLEQNRNALGHEGEFVEPKLNLFRDPSDTRAIQWVGTYWGKNRDDDGGALFALTEHGDLVAAKRLSRVFSVRQGPVIQGLGHTVELYHRGDHPEGRDLLTISIAALIDGEVVVLWSRPTEIPGDTDEAIDRLTWRIPRDGAPIQTRLYREVSHANPKHWSPPTYEPQHEQRWCWTPAERTYKECGRDLRGR